MLMIQIIILNLLNRLILLGWFDDCALSFLSSHSIRLAHQSFASFVFAASNILQASPFATLYASFMIVPLSLYSTISVPAALLFRATRFRRICKSPACSSSRSCIDCTGSGYRLFVQVTLAFYSSTSHSMRFTYFLLYFFPPRFSLLVFYFNPKFHLTSLS